MKLSIDELIAIDAALEIALTTTDVEATLIDLQHCHDDDTVRAMIWDWRQLRQRISREVDCPDSDTYDAAADAAKDEDARRDEDPRRLNTMREIPITHEEEDQ